MITLDWLGCATFRLTIDDLVVFLDAYMDRAAGAPAVGITAGEVERADYILVGHSHFDHIAGAEVIARNTGARIIGSNESCRVMRACGIADAQLLPSQGGERHRLASGVTVRVFPSLHGVLWTGLTGIGEERAGDTGLCEDEKATMMQRHGLAAIMGEAPEESRAAAFLAHARGATGSARDGGALIYLIETGRGTILFQDTSGCWSAIMRGIHADVAILAIAARPNVDGEPYQGSMASFIAQEAAWVGARTVIPAHHDNWTGLMDVDAPDLSRVREALAPATRGASLVEMGYLGGVAVL